MPLDFIVWTLPEVVAASHRGHDDADKDIAAHRPRIAFIGLLRDDESALDPETGLTRFSVGCCKTWERIAYCDAYNDTIDESYRAGALAEMTLRRKATTREAVEARFASRRAAEIQLGGPGVDGPDGRFHVEIAPSEARSVSALWSRERSSGERRELRYIGGDHAKVLFDDFGTTLFVRDDVGRLYVTFHLPTALLLEVFPDPERTR